MPQPTIFISYSQEDEAEKDELVAQLGVLQHAGLVDMCSDARITTSSGVQQAVDSAIAQAKKVI